MMLMICDQLSIVLSSSATCNSNPYEITVNRTNNIKAKHLLVMFFADLLLDAV